MKATMHSNNSDHSNSDDRSTIPGGERHSRTIQIDSPPSAAGRAHRIAPAPHPRLRSGSGPLGGLIGLMGLLLALSSAGMRPGAQQPLLPDPSLTPGDTLDVTRDDICVPGYAHKVRDVPAEVKRQAYAQYGITNHRPGDYEVDHLISLELGGSNSLRNLWPQSYKTQPWNAHIKDRLENELHDEVCAGKIPIKIAQRDIARNWIAAYKTYFHTTTALTHAGRPGEAGAPAHSSPAAARNARISVHGLLAKLSHRRGSMPSTGSPSARNARTKVWVNTRSGVYWRPGTRYYGKTAEGRYMSESQAIRQGYRAAKDPTNGR
jgi:hypothetical protein